MTKEATADRRVRNSIYEILYDISGVPKKQINGTDGLGDDLLIGLDDEGDFTELREKLQEDLNIQITGENFPTNEVLRNCTVDDLEKHVLRLISH